MPIPTKTPTLVKKASFWKRLIAYIIDYVIVSLFIMTPLTLLHAIQPEHQIISLIAFLTYGTISEYLVQTTVGKKIMKIKIIQMNRKLPTLLQVIQRNFGKLISALPLFYGFLRILAPHQSQTIHDELARCLVVEQPEPAGLTLKRKEHQTKVSMHSH